MTENLLAHPPILPPKIYQAVAQYVEARWPASATYKRKGTVRAKVMRVRELPLFEDFPGGLVQSTIHS